MSLVLLALAACNTAAPVASPSPRPAPTTSAATLPPASTPVPTPSAAVTSSPPPTARAATPLPSFELPDLVGEVPGEILLQIMQQVASATGTDLRDLEIDEARAVTWPDGSLGCPEPDQMYTQALVDGYWVVIIAGGETYDFRVGANGQFKFCPPGRGVPPPDLSD